jgi:hypothetical protein
MRRTIRVRDSTRNEKKPRAAVDARRHASLQGVRIDAIDHRESVPVRDCVVDAVHEF